MHSVRTLLEGVLDYAGLFPPAKLDMATTVRNYDAYRRSSDVWMLGRIVIPVSRLAEFESASASLLPSPGAPGEDDDAWPISALTAPAGDAQFDQDIALITAFNERHASQAGSAIIDVIEVKASSGDDVDRGLDLLPDEVFPYFEIPVDRDPRGLVAALASLDAGAKIRTGGLTADAHPSPEQVAAFVAACAAAEVPFKATAGLHHPMRHLARDVGCRQHGFLNVFLGASLLWHERIDATQLALLIADEAPDAFRFTDDGVSWREARLTVAETRSARDAFAHAFGSCSFAEPLADLRSMRLVTPETAAR